VNRRPDAACEGQDVKAKRPKGATVYWSRDREMQFARIRAEAEGFGLRILEANEYRKPWGGFVKFDPACLAAFRRAYWKKGLNEQWQESLRSLWKAMRSARGLALDAKLLLVAPGQRFSLQEHERRAELWRVLEGPVDVVMGEDEEHLRDHEVRPGEIIRIPERTLHRAAAPVSSWGVIAEFWQHIDPAHPSDEDDVIRHADDYERRGPSS